MDACLVVRFLSLKNVFLRCFVALLMQFLIDSRTFPVFNQDKSSREWNEIGMKFDRLQFACKDCEHVVAQLENYLVMDL